MCVGGEIERYPGARSWWWCVGAHGVSYKGCGAPYQILLMLNNVVVKHETDSETTDDARRGVAKSFRRSPPSPGRSSSPR